MKRRRMKKKKKESSSSAIIPEELLIEILLRLPVKSLIRFKCVSKSWRSLISDRKFGQSHFDLAASITQKLLLYPNGALKMLAVDFNTPSLHHDSTASVMKLNFPLPRVRNPEFPLEISGSCRGFTLFHCYPNFYLWNPCTGFHRKIPYPSDQKFPDYETSAILLGFGYDDSKDDYLVTLAYCDESSNGGEIFSLRANAWKQLESSQMELLGAYKYFYYKGGDAGLFFSGNIHWIGYRKLMDSEQMDSDYDDDIVEIVAFDLKDRVFFEISLPKIDSYSYGELRVFGKCLGVWAYNEIDYNINMSFNIWLMEDYKDQSSWTKIHVVSHDVSTRDLSPICLNENGDIVGTNGDTELVKFNRRGRVLERRNFDDKYHCSFACPKKWVRVLHTESLLSLPCDN